MPLQTSNLSQKSTENATVQHSKRRGFMSFGRWALFGLLLLIWLAVWKHQAVYDWFRLQNYNPPAAVVQLANQTTMNDYSRRLFYINHPEINSRQQFFNSCEMREFTIVLGCYHGGETGIFILEIHNNSELAGVEQVTAAHEVLHAAYERLSSTEKDNVKIMLKAYYDSGEISQSIQEEIAAYKKSEPKQIYNEMHSIFGTEISNLPSGLEKYYTHYFNNRQAITDYAKHYQGAFRQREEQIKNYKQQLSSLKYSIESNKQSLSVKSAQLKSKKAELERDKERGDNQEYNRDAKEYNQMVREYNSLLSQTKQMINQYNDLVKKINGLVLEEQQLVQQLSGKNLKPKGS